ncbi:MAG: hypothetical protein R3B53_00525 [Candidatus Paceibacterota bacterium]
MDSKPEEFTTNPETQTNAESTTPVTPSPVAETTTEDTKSNSSELEFSEHTMMAALAYVGPLVFIPLFMKKDDPFTFFHVKQGLVLFGMEVVLWLVGGWFMMGIMFGPMSTVLMVIKLVIFVLAILGIMNALKKVQKEIPVVGKFAHHIKI